MAPRTKTQRSKPPSSWCWLLLSLSAGACSPANGPRHALQPCTESDYDLDCSYDLGSVPESSPYRSSFERCTFTTRYEDKVEVVELRGDGSLSVTGGHGPPVARPAPISDHDRSIALRVLTNPALVDLMRSGAPTCKMPRVAPHVQESLQLVLAGKSYTLRSWTCDDKALALARHTMVNLSRRYGPSSAY